MRKSLTRKSHELNFLLLLLLSNTSSHTLTILPFWFSYYDLATDFYEYGWGESFHFATRHAKEPLKQAIARHEHYLALKMGIKKDDKILDLGCGVGGPMREIAIFSGAKILGINNNAYQVLPIVVFSMRELYTW